MYEYLLLEDVVSLLSLYDILPESTRNRARLSFAAI